MDLLIPPGQQAALAALTDPLNFPTEYLGWLDDRIKLVGGRSATAVTTTTSAMSGGPPATAADGDIWFATSVDANGTRWMFQYSASSGSSFKWEFVGGAPARSEVDADETTSSVSYVDLATTGPSVTVARAGDYVLRFGAQLYNSTTTNNVYLSPKKGSATASDNDAVLLANPAVNSVTSVARERTFTGMAANNVIDLQARAAGGVGHFNSRFLYVTPIRVS